MIRTPVRITPRLVGPLILPLLLISLWSCGGGPRSPAEPSVLPTTPVPGPSGTQVIQLGEPVNGTITSNDPECRFTTSDGGWAGLCDAFDFTAPAAGTLVATARWSADAPLAMFLKTSTGEQIDLFCCNALVGRIPVDANTTYRVELAYVGRPAGYPRVPPVDYTLEAALITGSDTQPRGTVHAIVFGDPSRTQRLSRARLEVFEGPSAGTSAQFNDATGVYEFRDLPAGFVQIRASAPEFAPIEVRLPVGANIVRELVLQRTAALPDARHTLGGTTFVADRPNAAYVGVKIEILDGPLEGIFTFTDEFFAQYFFRDMPPGPIQVRASSAQVHAQTLTVDVSGNTTLNFFMKAK